MKKTAAFSKRRVYKYVPSACLLSRDKLTDPHDWIILMDSIMEGFMEKTTDIHIFLPTVLVARLDRLAGELEIRRTELLRRVLVQFLNRREADRIEQEMAEYIAELAPHSGELVKESEKHTLSRLLRETKW